MLKGDKMIHDSRLSCQASLVPPVICPHCHTPIEPQDLPSNVLSGAVINALLDRFLSIEAELQQIRKLLVEEVLP
jgi:hypothetical protein